MSFTEQITGQHLHITPRGYGEVHLHLPPLDVFPPKMRKAIDQLLTAQAAANEARRKPVRDGRGQIDQKILLKTDDEVLTAWRQAADMSAATTSSARTEYEEQFSLAASRYGRAIEEAGDALAGMALAAVMRETAVDASSRIGLDMKSKNRAYQQVRFIAESVAQLPSLPAIDAE